MFRRENCVNCHFFLKEARFPHLPAGKATLVARRESLEDTSAEVGQEQRAEPARQKPGQVEDLDVRERQLAHAGTRALARRPSISRASATVAARRPMSSAICRAFAISSPLDFAISPSGR